MTFRNIALATVTLVALSPVIATASPEKVSVRACARAFASSIGAVGDAPAYKVAYPTEVTGSLADFYPTGYTFMLEAHDSKSGAAIARATCSTNSRGAVTAISAIPLDEKSARLAAGL